MALEVVSVLSQPRSVREASAIAEHAAERLDVGHQDSTHASPARPHVTALEVPSPRQQDEFQPVATYRIDRGRQALPAAGLPRLARDAAPRPIRVLLVEDDPGDARLRRETLAMARRVLFAITHVRQRDEALQRLATERFDAVLLDLSLPDSLGRATLLTLHAHIPGTPLVVLTGLDDDTTALEAVQAGAQDSFVHSEVEGNGLARAIRYAMERQRSEEVLRRQRDWFEVTLASIGDAVIATDVSGRIIFLNAEATTLTGWTSDEALGRHADEVCQIIHAQTRQPVDSPIAHVLQEGTTISLAEHTALIARDGHERPIAESCAPIRSHDGTLHGAVLVLHAISERQHLEEQLRQAQTMEAIGTLSGGIAHDFNNILAAILGFTEMALYDTPETSPVHRSAGPAAGLSALDDCDAAVPGTGYRDSAG